MKKSAAWFAAGVVVGLGLAMLPGLRYSYDTLPGPEGVPWYVRNNRITGSTDFCFMVLGQWQRIVNGKPVPSNNPDIFDRVSEKP